MELNGVQLEMLSALVELYEELGRPVRSSELAERIGRSSGTVRNTISALKALGLVESRTGPLGGYIPTSKSLELVERGSWGLREPLRLEVEGLQTSIRVVDVELIDLPGPLGARAILRVTGRRVAGRLRRGSRIRLGPTPYTRMVLAGVVVSVNSIRGEIVVDVDVLTAIPRVGVGEFMTSRLVTVSESVSVREVAEMLLRHDIRAVPVVDEDGVLRGLASSRRVLQALLEGAVDSPVGDYVERDAVTATPEEDILEVMETMERRKVGRVVIVDSRGRPIGIVTRTDILGRLIAAYR